MTALVVDSRQIPVDDRAEAVTHVVHETLEAVDIAFNEHSPAEAAGTIYELGASSHECREVRP